MVVGLIGVLNNDVLVVRPLEKIDVCLAPQRDVGDMSNLVVQMIGNPPLNHHISLVGRQDDVVIGGQTFRQEPFCRDLLQNLRTDHADPPRARV